MLSVSCVPHPRFDCIHERAPDSVWRGHLVWPLLLMTLLAAVWMALDGDQWLADQLYRWQGGQWALRESWWLENVLHEGGRSVSQWAGLVTLAGFIVSYCTPRLRAWRTPLLYLLLAVALSSGLVSLLKHLTQMDCPWALQRYGGQRPFVGLFAARPAELGRAACFPAGHASAGYAWVALYFGALRVRPQWRWWGLGLALGAGAVFGLVQQLRGAHFLSHDLTTLAISWCVAAGLWVWMFRQHRDQA